MLRFSLLLILPQLLHATTLNYTQINLCTDNIDLCHLFNHSNVTGFCKQQFKDCLQEAEVPVKKPLSCYVNDAAQRTFKYYWQITVITLSITTVIMPIVGFLLEHKFACCKPSEPPDIQQNSPEDPGKTEGKIEATHPGLSLAIKIYGALSVVLPTVMSYLAGSAVLNQLEKIETSQATCDHDLENQ